MAVDDLLDFLPLYPDDTEETILARMRASANEGLDPVQDADRWVDTREGSHWYVSVMPSVRELARLYDLAGSEVPAAGFPVWAWGDYLDDHAEVQNIERLPATPALGDVTFSGAIGTVIAAGSVVGVEPLNPEDEEAPEFEVIEGGVIEADPSVEAVAVVEMESYEHQSPTAEVVADPDAFGGAALEETSAGTPGQNSTRIAPGTPGIPPAGTYAVWVLGRTLAAGSPGGVQVGFWEGATAQDRSVNDGDLITSTEYEWFYLGQIERQPGEVEPYFKAWGGAGVRIDRVAYVAAADATLTQGSLTVPVRATEAGELGNVGAGAITVLSTPIAAVEVTNFEATRSGSDPQTDEALRERVLGAYTGQGAGNRRDYERWARAWEGVGRATVIPLWNGPGTVKVIVSDAQGQPLAQATVDALQADLDPTPGMADGQAPVGAHVTVTTATARLIEATATVEPEPGYSLDAFGGTIALRADIVAALRDYVERVPPGGEIVVAQLAGRIATVTGVHDVRIDSLEGVAPPVNVAISQDPAEAPQLAVPTLNEGAL